MLAHVKALSPGKLIIDRFDQICGANNFRWWWDEIAGTCRQFQWTGSVLIILKFWTIFFWGQHVHYTLCSVPYTLPFSGVVGTAITLALLRNASNGVKEINHCEFVSFC